MSPHTSLRPSTMATATGLGPAGVGRMLSVDLVRGALDAGAGEDPHAPVPALAPHPGETEAALLDDDAAHLVVEAVRLALLRDRLHHRAQHLVEARQPGETDHSGPVLGHIDEDGRELMRSRRHHLDVEVAPQGGDVGLEALGLTGQSDPAVALDEARLTQTRHHVGSPGAEDVGHLEPALLLEGRVGGQEDVVHRLAVLAEHDLMQGEAAERVLEQRAVARFAIAERRVRRRALADVADDLEVVLLALDRQHAEADFDGKLDPVAPPVQALEGEVASLLLQLARALGHGDLRLWHPEGVDRTSDELAAGVPVRPEGEVIGLDDRVVRVEQEDDLLGLSHERRVPDLRAVHFALGVPAVVPRGDTIASVLAAPHPAPLCVVRIAA